MQHKFLIILFVSLSLSCVNSWIITEELMQAEYSWLNYELNEFILYPDSSDLTDFSYITEDDIYECSESEISGKEWINNKILGGPGKNLKKDMQIEFQKPISTHQYLQITGYLILYGYTGNETVQLFQSLPDNTKLMSEWGPNGKQDLSSTVDGVNGVVSDFCSSGIEAKRYEISIKGDSKGLTNIQLFLKTFGGSSANFRVGISDLKICASDTDAGDLCDNAETALSCGDSQVEYNNMCKTQEEVTTCINSLIPLRTFNGVYQFSPVIEYKSETSKIIHKYFIKDYDHKTDCSTYEIYAQTSIINTKTEDDPLSNKLKLVAASGDEGAHIYFETSLEYINQVVNPRVNDQGVTSFTIKIQVNSNNQMQYQEYHDLNFKQPDVGSEVISDLFLSVSVKPQTVNGLVNHLGIESNLKICENNDCSIVSNPSNPYKTQKGSTIKLRHTITSTYYHDNFKLGLDSVKMGPYTMPEASFTANQGYVDLEFKASIAGGALEFTIQSKLIELSPSSPTRRVLNENDYGVGSKIVLEIEDNNDNNNNEKLNEKEDSVDDNNNKIIYIDGNNNENKNTILMVALGVSVGISLLLVLGCVYILREKQQKPKEIKDYQQQSNKNNNQSDDTDDNKNKRKLQNNAQDYELAVARNTETDINEKYLISTIRTKEGGQLSSTRTFRLNQNNQKQ